ncbi:MULTISPECIES: nucleoid-associated protein [Sphingobacterium]|uniref:nucleoid-associated protein n=1 Tax=Sphingobacterium TaxID=28453 RepID=UPI00257953FC|nr:MULTISPECIES: nucleoid-associated protein [Sphingobacterium]
MLFFADSKIEGVAVHRVGNKAQDEFYILSDQSLDIDEETQAYLMCFFIDPFHKSPRVYRLSDINSSLDLNEVYYYACRIFDGRYEFLEASKILAQRLYEVSNHPKIKAGEFYTVKFSNVLFEGEEWEALALFKVDNQESFLNANPENGTYKLKIANGVGVGKIDKAVIILNCEADHGFKVILAENTKSFDASFWRDEFLQVKLRNDSNFQTEATIRIFKTFVDGLDEVFEVEKMDKIDLLNKAQAYFKNNETFSQEEFEESVIGSEQAIELFRISKANAEELLDTKIPDDFPLSNAVIKKSRAGFKNMIKLDKNFQINVHGKRELIERGFDEKKGMNYYKVYFENES